MNRQPEWRIVSIEVPSHVRVIGFDTVLCRFTVTFGPILMTGASLVMSSAGICTVWLPRSPGNRIVIRDRNERKSLTKSAIEEFARATGRVIADPPLAPASPEGEQGDPARNSVAA